MLKGKTVELRYQVSPPESKSSRSPSVKTWVSAWTGEDNMYIGDWRIDCEDLFHKHPDEVMWKTHGFGVIEYKVNERACWKCKATCPDSIWFIHKLHQL